MIWWLACHPTPVESDVDTETPDTDVPITAFAEPPIAEDLDPDPTILHVALTLAPLGEGLAFNGTIPGPTLRAHVGDTVVVDIENALSENTTVHWHGMAVPWAADGVTWMQDPIVPGEKRTVTFVAKQAGTFWYHPHFDSGLGQVSKGLFGVVVVEDPADPPVDADAVLVFDQGPRPEGTDPHAERLAPFRVNGLDDPIWQLAAGSVVRARMVNASESGYLDLRAAPGTWIGGDQGLFAAPRVPADGLVLAPGDRAEVVYTIGDSLDVLAAPYSLHGGTAWGEPQPLFRIETPTSTSAPGLPPYAFAGTPPTPDTGEAADITWVFSGDGEQWFINGEQFPDVTIPELALGTTAIIEIRNLSPTEHPFHLHGMKFEVLSLDGAAPPARDFEDTVNVPIHGILRIKLLADNPGDWMAHCHILPHAHDGMMTVLRVNP
jgi:FtsP/CotA-like multicopper oxidase with cupredoxin domain